MSNRYRIFGAEMSPYSVKVRAYFRYKSIEHDWVSRSADTEEEFKKYARIPIIPAVATPDGQGMQDSTPIIETLEKQFPEPSIHPADPMLRFLSALIEEYGDEWGNKLMFHHRWWDEADQVACARVLARTMFPAGDDASIENVQNMVKERMSGRRDFVGSSEATAPLIAEYFDNLIAILESHLATRPYLFGERPAFGDFGLSAQLYEAALDPTCGGIMRSRTPNVLAWCYRMLEPRDDGPFESWEQLAPTMKPLLADIGRYFLPWSTANARALEAGEASFSVKLAGETYSQPPQKYHAKSLAVLRARYAEAAGAAGLSEAMDEGGCTPYLA